MKRTNIRKALALVLSMVMIFTTMSGMAFPSTTAAIIMGDFDGDGEMTSADARAYLQQVIDESSLSDMQLRIGDLNADGLYNTADARCILKHIVTEAENVRAIWIPYWEVGSLMSSGNIATTKTKIDALFDNCVERGANTIYFHVRANSDAYYNSALFKENGYAATLINAGFDPFAYAVDSAHNHGLKIEAWINPYRIGSNASNAATDAYFSFNGGYYYVPTDTDVQALVVNGVKEVVNNYNIDGVHFDDYFYPTDSMVSNTLSDFEKTDYAAYTAAGGKLSVNDWRRENINMLVSAAYDACHARTGCVFGISPSYDFEANYDKMYADAATWAANPGYVDYLCPQLYTGFKHGLAPYDAIIKRWDALERHDSLKMIAGLALYKTGLLEDKWAGTNGITEWADNDDIMERQIALTRQLNWDGVALYSYSSFTIDSTRDATIAATEIATACEKWLVFLS